MEDDNESAEHLAAFLQGTIKAQQKAYAEHLRQTEEAWYAHLAEFISFIDDLSDEQLDYTMKMMMSYGENHVSSQMVGIIIGSRVYQRGLMVDGRSYEEVFGIDAGGEVKGAGEVASSTALKSEVDEELADYSHTKPANPFEWTMTDKQTAEALNVELRDDGSVICRGVCGGSAGWESLQSRTDDEVNHGGCPHCISKTKWG